MAIISRAEWIELREKGLASNELAVVEVELEELGKAIEDMKKGEAKNGFGLSVEERAADVEGKIDNLREVCFKKPDPDLTKIFERLSEIGVSYLKEIKRFEEEKNLELEQESRTGRR